MGQTYPSFLEEIQQYPPHIMLWVVRTTNEIIIGPYFFETSVSGSSYFEMLFQWLVPEIDRHDIIDSVVQQDGAQGISALHLGNV